MDKDFRKFYVNDLCTTHAVVCWVTVVGPHHEVAWWGPTPPEADLWHPSLFRVKTDLRGFSGLFANIFCTAFLKYKYSRKQELALGTGLIG